MITREILIQNKLGLHARAAAKLVQTAAKFRSDIKVQKGAETVDAKSILGILLLAAAKGVTLTVVASGPDEEEAVNAIEDLITRKFDESE